MITILAGDNWFALKSELDKAVTAFRAKYGGLAIERIYAPDVEINNILGAVGGMSLFSEDRMVIISDLAANKAASADIEKILGGVGDNTHLVLIESSLDKRSAYYKTLKKQKNFKEFSDLAEMGRRLRLAGGGKDLHGRRRIFDSAGGT